MGHYPLFLDCHFDDQNMIIMISTSLALIMIGNVMKMITKMSLMTSDIDDRLTRVIFVHFLNYSKSLFSNPKKSHVIFVHTKQDYRLVKIFRIILSLYSLRNLRRECKFVPRGIGMQGNVKRIKGRVPEKRLLFFWILSK